MWIFEYAFSINGIHHAPNEEAPVALGLNPLPQVLDGILESTLTPTH